jgi:hypothetical protein
MRGFLDLIILRAAHRFGAMRRHVFPHSVACRLKFYEIKLSSSHQEARRESAKAAARRLEPLAWEDWPG